MWRHADLGVGKLYADDQAVDMAGEPEALAAFTEWVDGFISHVAAKGIVPSADQDAEGARSTTQ